MPSNGSIIVHVFDLEKIMDALEAEKYSGQFVKIIDDGDNLVIRDPGDFKIKSVTKTKTNEDAETFSDY